MSILDSLVKKSEKSNVPLPILNEVFKRGIRDYNSNKISIYEYALNRVNSFIAKGKAIQIDEDLNFILEVHEKFNKDLRDYLNSKFDKVQKLSKKQTSALKTYINLYYNDLVSEFGRSKVESALQNLTKLEKTLIESFEYPPPNKNLINWIENNRHIYEEMYGENAEAIMNASAWVEYNKTRFRKLDENAQDEYKEFNSKIRNYKTKESICLKNNDEKGADNYREKAEKLKQQIVVKTKMNESEKQQKLNKIAICEEQNKKSYEQKIYTQRDPIVRMQAKRIYLEQKQRLENERKFVERLYEDTLSQIGSAIDGKQKEFVVKFKDGSQTKLDHVDAKILHSTYKNLNGDYKPRFRELLNKSHNSFKLALNYALKTESVDLFNESAEPGLYGDFIDIHKAIVSKTGLMSDEADNNSIAYAHDCVIKSHGRTEADRQLFNVNQFRTKNGKVPYYPLHEHKKVGYDSWTTKIYEEKKKPDIKRYPDEMYPKLFASPQQLQNDQLIQISDDRLTSVLGDTDTDQYLFVFKGAPMRIMGNVLTYYKNNSREAVLLKEMLFGKEQNADANKILINPTVNEIIGNVLNRGNN